MISFSQKVILAPLAGISNSIFRRINKAQGADIVFSEMVSADGLIRSNKATNEYLVFGEEERPFGIQIFGTDPLVMAAAAREIEERIKPEIIDINFGCPVKKVVRRNGGSALLRSPSIIQEIVTAVVKAVHTPVTAKVRSGYKRREIKILEIAKRIEQAGASALTLHPRTQEDGFSGKADWDLISQVKETIKIPVIGNGDIFKGEDAIRMFTQTGCDSVMVARGTLGNPWIFGEIKALLEKKKYVAPSGEEKASICISHLEQMIDCFGERKGVYEMRKHFGWYLKGIPEAAQVRKKVFQEESPEKIKEIIRDFFAHKTDRENL